MNQRLERLITSGARPEDLNMEDRIAILEEALAQQMRNTDMLAAALETVARGVVQFNFPSHQPPKEKKIGFA